MPTKQERKLEEKRVCDRRVRDNPKYYQKYKNKTPGKACSKPHCCGNPRRESNHHKSKLTIQEKKFYASNDDVELQMEEAKILEEEVSGYGGYWGGYGPHRTYHAWMSVNDYDSWPCMCSMCYDGENADHIECDGPINKIKVA